MIRSIAIVLVLAVASCGTHTPTFRELERMSSDYEKGGASPLGAAEPTQGSDPCGARIYRPRIGTPIAGWEPPAGARVIRPGDAVTDDHRPERLNIRVDADGRVTALECF